MADGTIKVRIHAAPEKVRANKELLGFLCGVFELSGEEIKIVTGATSSAKVLDIAKDVDIKKLCS
jgi:uncharacterized protein YggU (UPF0235/DUF167 family)